MKPDEDAAAREALESLLAADMRELAAESEQIGQRFAGSHHVRQADFRALLHIMVAETAGTPIGPSDLRQRMGLSGAAITYLVDRLIQSGHVRREAHASDRRKVALRYSELGLNTARAFFTPLQGHTQRALMEFSDADLQTTHRVLAAVISAMRQFDSELGK